MFMLFEEMREDEQDVAVNWYYPEYDEDMKDAGIEYSEMVDVPFEFIEYKP